MSKYCVHGNGETITGFRSLVGEKLIEPFISSFWSADGKPGEITSNRFDRIAAEIPLSGDGIVICGPVEVETYLSVHFKVIESDQPPDHIIDNVVGIANKIAPLAGPGGAAVKPRGIGAVIGVGYEQGRCAVLAHAVHGAD